MNTVLSDTFLVYLESMSEIQKLGPVHFYWNCNEWNCASIITLSRYQNDIKFLRIKNYIATKKLSIKMIIQITKECLPAFIPRKSSIIIIILIDSYAFFNT